MTYNVGKFGNLDKKLLKIQKYKKKFSPFLEISYNDQCSPPMKSRMKCINWMITPSRVKKLQFEIYFYIYYYLTKDWESSQNKRTKVFQRRRTTFQTKYKKSNSGFARRKHVSMLIEQNILYATITLVLLLFCTGEFHKE